MNAYFIPNPKLMKAIVAAAKRGVDVHILLPAVSDVHFMPWASSLFYSELIRSGVEIFEFQNGILHAKAMIIDDWGLIGTSNLNYRSLQHDLEVDYVLSNQDSFLELKKTFMDYTLNSREIERHQCPRHTFFKRLFARIILLLKSNL